MSTKRILIPTALTALFAAAFLGALALVFLGWALILGVQVTSTASGTVLAISTATPDLEPGDRILRTPIGSPTELHEAIVARVSLEPAPTVWVTRHYENGESVDFPVGADSFLKPIASLPGWVGELAGKP